jgi:putative ABC transport system ATP-binding protein
MYRKAINKTSRSHDYLLLDLIFAVDHESVKPGNIDAFKRLARIAKSYPDRCSLFAKQTCCAMIELKSISKTYKGYGGNYPALSHINLTIEEGDYLIVMGKSGSGKSTLLNILSGIDRPDEGSLLFRGSPLEQLSESSISKWRGRHVGIVFQFYQLLPSLTAQDNLLFAMELVGVIPKQERKHRVRDLLTRVGLEGKFEKFPHQLSGGERQRVAIARALANDPPLLIADEPTGNLDSITSQAIHQIFEQLNKSGKTIVQVTHENVTDRPFNKLYHMKDGVLSTPN